MKSERLRFSEGSEEREREVAEISREEGGGGLRCALCVCVRDGQREREREGGGACVRACASLTLRLPVLHYHFFCFVCSGILFCFFLFCLFGSFHLRVIDGIIE